MKKATVNDSLEVSQPEGFRIMSHEELCQAYAFDYDCMWGMRDEERHVILAVFWKVSNKLVSSLASAKLVAEQAEKGLRRRYKKMGYHSDGLFETEVAGRKAWGFRYGHAPAGAAEQTCETVVVKDGTCCYTIMYHTRAECAQENRALYEEILASMQIRPKM